MFDRSSAVAARQGEIAAALSDGSTRFMLHLRCTFEANSSGLLCTRHREIPRTTEGKP